MSLDREKERKIGNDDIVDGVVQRDIFDARGQLQVKAGTRISEERYRRLRKEGLVHDDVSYAGSQSNPDLGAQHTVHGRLSRIITRYKVLQEELIDTPLLEHGKRLKLLAADLKSLSNENIHQVIGELFLGEKSNYRFIKPLYIAASLHELIERYNKYKGEEVINPDHCDQLLLAALCHNLGLMQYDKKWMKTAASFRPKKGECCARSIRF